MTTSHSVADLGHQAVSARPWEGVLTKAESWVCVLASPAESRTPWILPRMCVRSEPVWTCEDAAVQVPWGRLLLPPSPSSWSCCWQQVSLEKECAHEAAGFWVSELTGWQGWVDMASCSDPKLHQLPLTSDSWPCPMNFPGHDLNLQPKDHVLLGSSDISSCVRTAAMAPKQVSLW